MLVFYSKTSNTNYGNVVLNNVPVYVDWVCILCNTTSNTSVYQQR